MSESVREPESVERAPVARRCALALSQRLFTACPPFVASRLTTNALRISGVRIGEATVFWSMPRLAGQGDVCSRLSVGTYCGFNVGVYFELENTIEIGDHVAVGHDVMFLTRTHDGSDPKRRGGRPGSAPIQIGNGAWLGARCTIMPGVKVGAGSVIGAAVTVDKDVPPDVLVMGKRRVSLAKWR